MYEWCTAHPWMTFFIVIIALLVLDSIIANICIAISRRFPKNDKPFIDAEISVDRKDDDS